MEANLDLVSDEDMIENASDYRHIVGLVQYLTLMRPNIVYMVSKLAQFVATLKLFHWNTMKHVLRYLSDTQTRGIRLNNKVISPFTPSAMPTGVEISPITGVNQAMLCTSETH